MKKRPGLCCHVPECAMSELGIEGQEPSDQEVAMLEAPEDS